MSHWGRVARQVVSRLRKLPEDVVLIFGQHFSYALVLCQEAVAFLQVVSVHTSGSGIFELR